MEKIFYITTSWDDGDIYDIRLSNLLLKYKIPATFYIPSNHKLTKKQIKDLSKNFEIGGHTKSHKELTKITFKNAENEILQNKKYLEKIINKKVTSFCYPRGRYNQEVKQLVGFLGYKYARTTRIFSKTVGDKLLVGTSVHAFSHLYIDWEILAKVYFLYTKTFGGIYHLWGHSWEIEKYNQWEKLENVLRYIAKHTSPDARVVNGKILEKLKYKKDEYYKNN